MTTFKQKLKLAKESAATIAKNVADGKDLKVSEEEYNRRQSICNNCECHVPKTNQCGDCGCFLSAKARLNGMKCPRNKW